MKKTFLKIVSRRFVTAVVIATSLFAFAPAQSMAKSTKTIEIISADNTSSVQFLSSGDNSLLFDVKINNTNGDKFTLLIQNEAGDVLFSKDYNDKSFNKRIKLLKTDDGGSYHFVIRSSNKDLENTYAVSKATRVVDDVVITKL
jgi:hypothetical protein